MKKDKISKKCSVCHKIKALKEFVKNKRCKDGCERQCNSCRSSSRKSYMRNYYRVNIVRHRHCAKLNARKYRKEKPEACKASRERYYPKRLLKKEQNRAVWAVGNAVRKGRLKKTPCAICGGSERVEGHHSDYTKPLEVIWLCQIHHMAWHRVFLAEYKTKGVKKID